MKSNTVPIERLYSGLFDGPHATPKPSDEGPIFLGIGNITEDGKLDLSDVRHIAEDDFPLWTKRVSPRPGDIVFTYEATLNRYAIIPEGFKGCLGRRTALIRPDPTAVNPRFLFFYFFSEDWRRTIERNILSGATVDRIPLTMFPAFPVTLPIRAAQNRIAEILSAYDDLIENNARRIKILEEMAQMLYREWFVNFRFPGHEKVPMMESALGPIPEGWSVRTIESLVLEFIDYRGKTPKKLGSDWSESGILALSALNVKHGRLVNLDKAKFVDEDLYKRWMKSELRAGDILVTSEAPLGEVYFLPDARRFCLSQRVFSIRADESKMKPCLLFFTLSSPEGQQQLTARASGTTVSGIRQADLRRVPVVQPPQHIQEAGERHLRPFLVLIDRIHQKNSNLRSTRDLLLPKLISGEIPVEAAEETAAELMEAEAQPA